MEAAAFHQLALIVEDEINLAAIFATALERAGFKTLSVNDGKSAIDHLKGTTESPKLVLLDLNLPFVSGKDILRYIRGDERFSDTRVILATAESATVANEMDDKSDLVLFKPISFTQLRDLASRLH